ncbi:response regulator transcription factor [Micromonospora sp. DT47]|uniref:response regulator transcription factor n=1 Tax=Micromonospora sp. DT47 TaxID=3393431 RepID=UPI003CF23636
MPTRIVIADDSYLIRQAVAGLVGDEDDLAAVATVGDVDALLAAVEQHRPDVVVTDVRMPPTHTDEGIRAAQRVRDAAPQTGVVVLSQFVRREYAVQLFEGGAGRRAYLLKDRVAEAGQLAHAIREVARGGSVIDPLVVEALLTPAGGDRRLGRLTPRELDVLREMAAGRNNAGIGEALSLTERAVAKHINAIFAKLKLTEEEQVHRRVQAVLLFLAAS